MPVCIGLELIVKIERAYTSTDCLSANQTMRLRKRRQFFFKKTCTQTGCDIAIIDVLLKIAYLTHDIEQKSNGTFKFKHFAVQAQVIFGAFSICPYFVGWSFRIPVEFRVFVAFYGILETSFYQIAARSCKYHKN